MPNTPQGFPYPNATDPVSSGAANFQALATAIDAKVAEVAYAQIVANLAINATSAAAPTLIVATPSVACPAVPLMIEFYGTIATAPANVTVGLILYVDNVAAGQICTIAGLAASAFATQVGRRRLTLTSGTHVFDVRGYNSIAAGQASILAGDGSPGTFEPAFLRVMRA